MDVWTPRGHPRVQTGPGARPGKGVGVGSIPSARQILPGPGCPSRSPGAGVVRQPCELALVTELSCRWPGAEALSRALLPTLQTIRAQGPYLACSAIGPALAVERHHDGGAVHAVGQLSVDPVQPLRRAEE